MWTINENLLQSYRLVFIESQSFFLAVGAILTLNTSHDWIFYVFTGLAIIIIWYIWFRVVRVRHLIVDYHKFIHLYILKNQIEPEGICSEKLYINNCDRTYRKNTNKILDIDKNWRLTRFKIDLLLPIIFTVSWILLSLYKLFP